MASGESQDDTARQNAWTETFTSVKIGHHHHHHHHHHGSGDSGQDAVAANEAQAKKAKDDQRAALTGNCKLVIVAASFLHTRLKDLHQAIEAEAQTFGVAAKPALSEIAYVDEAVDRLQYYRIHDQGHGDHVDPVGNITNEARDAITRIDEYTKTNLTIYKHFLDALDAAGKQAAAKDPRAGEKLASARNNLLRAGDHVDNGCLQLRVRLNATLDEAEALSQTNQ